MFALIRFRYVWSSLSETFFRLYLLPHPQYKHHPPPPLVYKLTQNPCEVILAQGFNVEFYGSSELDWYVQ